MGPSAALGWVRESGEGVRVHFPRKAAAAAAAASAPSPFPHGKYEIIYRAPTDVRGKVKGGERRRRRRRSWNASTEEEEIGAKPEGRG